MSGRLAIPRGKAASGCNGPVADHAPPWVATREQEVILGVLRSDRGGDVRVQDVLLRGIEWQTLRDIALHHGVLPIVAARLETIGQGLMPNEEASRWYELRRTNARRSLVMTAELLSVLGILGSHGIEAIPFKGPVLALHAYGDSGLRQFVDLDILVHRRDLRKVREVLLDQRFVLRDRFTAAQERAHLKRANEFTFTSPNGKVLLDVHWRFAADYLAVQLDADAAFARQEALNLEGHRIPVLSADDMILYLCFHGAFHLWTKLSGICDLARLVDADRERDWQGLLRKAEQAGLRRAFLLGMALVQDVLAVEIPVTIQSLINSDPITQRLRVNVTSGLFGRSAGEPGFLETARFQLPLKDSVRDRLRYVFIRAFLPTVEDWKLVSLPDGLYGLYFLIRPFRLAGLLSSRLYPKNN